MVPLRRRSLGSYGLAENSFTGEAYGGLFEAKSTGTGWHYGVVGNAYGSSSNYVMGVKGYANCTSTGYVFGGWFYADSMGTGPKWGIWAHAPLAANSYAAVFDGNTYTTGSKSAAVKVDNGEYHLLYSQESPENWFEDFGEAQLVSGRTVVNLDPLFTQTVNTNISYHVFLTPEGDCNGLYVVNKTSNSFEVRELKGGNSDLTFSYRIVAKRRGYENLRLEKMKGPAPEEIVAEHTKIQTELEKERTRTGREK